MKIGLNLLYLLPGVVGGTETYAISLINALSQIDQVNEYRVFLNKESASIEITPNPNFKKILCPIRAKNRAVRYLWEQTILPFQARGKDLDLLHSFGYVQPLHLPSASIVTIHDLNFHNLSLWMPQKKRRALSFFVSRSARRADHIITVSEFSKRQIVNMLNIPEDKVTVTYNAVGQEARIVQSIDILSKQFKIQQPYILALSSLSPHKNMASLIKAFAILRRSFSDLNLVIAGHFPNNNKSLEMIDSNQEPLHNVIFTGYVDDYILSTLYAHAEAFAFPSLYEGFGIPVLEAFMHGAPVACSRAAALPEIAGDAACYFDPTDIEEMAEVISRIISSKKLRASLVKRGKNQAAKFTWEETARKTLNIYKQVIGDA